MRQVISNKIIWNEKVLKIYFIPPPPKKKEKENENYKHHWYR